MIGVGGYFGTAVLLIFSLYWVGGTLKRLPQDMGTIRSYTDYTERRGDYWSEVGIVLIYWISSIVIAVTVLLPMFNLFAQGIVQWVELIRGFMN